MIEKIGIKNIATYGSIEEIMADLNKINFVYGSNATGKTTISRIIADKSSFDDCTIKWASEVPLKTLVYNRDFVDRNFNESVEIKGIFTLGEEDNDILEKITAAKNELNQLNEDISKFTTTLSGENGNDGKRAELAQLETDFANACWKLKVKYEKKFKDAFRGSMGSKNNFKRRLISESASNSSTFIPLANLEQKAETVFGDAPQRVSLLMVPRGSDLLAHEANSILAKKVIGKTDVDIAALIQKLNNSDWIKQGRKFYNPEERVCPFCQQETPHSLEENLNEYFDESFNKDTASIEKLYLEYKTDSDRILHSIQALLEEPSRFLNAEILQSEFALLNSKIQSNIQHIEEKRLMPSKSINLDSLENVLSKMKKQVEEANSRIWEHNWLVSNFLSKKKELTGQVWRYFLEFEIKNELTVFKQDKVDIEKAIQGLRTRIVETTEKKQEKEQEIRSLEKDTTSIQPTIDDINNLLRVFGFTGFVLAKSEHDRFYKIQRSDGSDAKETLSEGERSFIAFLYFYHLLKGSLSETGITSDRVVVFDDPVSSLDSDILFVVSSLIKEIFNEVRSESGTIRQVFVLTHNVYFHKEVSFNRKRPTDGKLNDETFWIVRRAKQKSKLLSHESNPIKTSYELLWSEVRNPDRDNLAIQNSMRRILENYFKILGNVDPDEICARFEGKEKLICQSLFSWVNDGSHSAHDSLFVSIDNTMVDKFLSVFKHVFEKMGHMGHYEMMMKSQSNGEKSETAQQVA